YSLAKTLWVLATRQSYPLSGYLTRQVPQFLISSYITDAQAYKLDALVEQATHPDPHQRPAMREVADELAAWLMPAAAVGPMDDLSDLRTRFAPLFQGIHDSNQKLRECQEHLNDLVRMLHDRLTPLADSVRRVTGFEVFVGGLGELESVDEAKAN